MASSSADADAERQTQIDQDAQLAQALAEEEEERRAPEPEPVSRPRKALRFAAPPPSEFVQDAPKVEFVAFSTNALRWHEMRRVIDQSDPLKGATDVQLRSRLTMVNCIVHAMTGAATSPMGAWESFGKGRAIAPELWEMLSMALVGRDSRTLGTLWRHMLAREEDGLDERLDMPAEVAAPHVGQPSALLDTIEFLALRTRKPRLLLELLYCQTPVGFDYASIAGHLTTIALAVLDGVFVGKHDGSEAALDASKLGKSGLSTRRRPTGSRTLRTTPRAGARSSASSSPSRATRCRAASRRSAPRARGARSRCSSSRRAPASLTTSSSSAC